MELESCSVFLPLSKPDELPVAAISVAQVTRAAAAGRLTLAGARGGGEGDVLKAAAYEGGGVHRSLLGRRGDGCLAETAATGLKRAQLD